MVTGILIAVLLDPHTEGAVTMVGDGSEVVVDFVAIVEDFEVVAEVVDHVVAVVVVAEDSTTTIMTEEIPTTWTMTEMPTWIHMVRLEGTPETEIDGVNVHLITRA